MKKNYIGLFIAILLLMTLFAGCRAEEETSVTAEPSPEVAVSPGLPEETQAPHNDPEDTEDGADSSEKVTAANVQIHAATDEFLSQFDAYHEFVEEPGGIRVVVTTEAPVLDFVFTELQWIEDVEVVGPLYSMDTLTPAMPFVVTWMPQCALPNRGISFTDGENVHREFSIGVSGEDGSLFLTELIPQIPSSERTPVEGIIDTPDQGWTAIYVTDSFSGATHQLSAEDAAEAYRLLTVMAAEEVLTPAHNEAQQSDPRFTLEIRNGDAVVVTIQSTETGRHFFRLTGTIGGHGDPGFVIGESEALGALLSAYF